MMPGNRGIPAAPGMPDASEQHRARRWRNVAIAGFTVAVLSASTFVAMRVLDDGAAQRHAAEQNMRRHRMAAIVSEIARETSIAARMGPLGHIADLSSQLRERVRGERGMTVRIIDPAGNTLAESMPMVPQSTRAPTWSFAVDDEVGHVVAFVQGSVWWQPTPDVDTLSDTVRRYGLSFWQPLLWFACAMVVLSLAAWRYLWRAGPRVRDVVLVRGVDDLLRADYRVLWRAGRRGAVLGDAMRSDLDRPRLVSRAVRRVDAAWQALHTYAGILDRTETDATQAVRRAADITIATGDARFPEATPDSRRVVAVAAQARWFSLLCGSGAGSVVGLLAYAGPTIPAAWYGAFCVASGWAAHRLWQRGVPSGTASHGMRASSAALWISVFVAATTGVHAWPALSVWPGVLLPALLSIGVGVLLRAAIASARAVQRLTLHDATFVDVDTTGADGRDRAQDGNDLTEDGNRHGDLGRASFTSCAVAVTIGALFVGPGLTGALASGWPSWCIALGIAGVPMTAAIQAWRWQAVAGPWQRSSTEADGRRSRVLPRAPADASGQRGGQ